MLKKKEKAEKEKSALDNALTKNDITTPKTKNTSGK